MFPSHKTNKMKNSIRLIAILLSFAFAGRAQITQPPQTPSQQQQVAPMHTPDTSNVRMNAPNTLPDGFILKDGKVSQVKGGVLTPITQNMKLANGTWVMPDGTLKDALNKTSKLQEGQEITSDGKLITPPDQPHE